MKKGRREEGKKGRKEERKKGRKEERKKGRREERKKGRKEERKKGRKEERKKVRKEEGKKGRKEERKKGRKEEGKKGRKEERKKGRKEERKKGRKEERKKGRKEERKKGRREEGKKGRKEERKKGRKEERMGERKRERERERHARPPTGRPKTTDKFHVTRERGAPWRRVRPYAPKQSKAKDSEITTMSTTSCSTNIQEMDDTRRMHQAWISSMVSLPPSQTGSWSQNHPEDHLPHPRPAGKEGGPCEIARRVAEYKLQASFFPQMGPAHGCSFAHDSSFVS